eukprot:TRINITY_DN8110_c0_g1_i2.p1 TRINITY_DN8110_c0_g1~~TRINITY_DN8110_c0_g1_i2.p1  ORF type:complete len:483 (-),score=50.89 TRINITY_DN8110_c0_g1_i2:242-1690(-)
MNTQFTGLRRTQFAQQQRTSTSLSQASRRLYRVVTLAQSVPQQRCSLCLRSLSGARFSLKHSFQSVKRLKRVYASEDLEQTSSDSTDTSLTGLLVSIQLSFAVWYVLGGQVLGSADPLTFSLLREIGGAGILLYIARKLDGPVKLQKAEDILHFCVLGFLCFGCIAGFTAGLSLVSDFNAAVMQPLTPVASLLFAVFEGQERLTWKSGVGVILSAIGSILIVLSQSGAGSADGGLTGAALLGNAFLLFSVLSYGYLYVYMNRVKDRYPAFTTTSWYYVVCTILCLFSCLQLQGWNVGFLISDVMSFNMETWGVLSYAIIFATVYNFSASTYATQRLPASTASAYQTLQPFFVALIGICFTGTQITPSEIGAAGIIVGGLYLCVTAESKVEEAAGNVEEVGLVQGMWQQVVDVLTGEGDWEEGKKQLGKSWNEFLVQIGVKEKELTWLEKKLTNMGWLAEEGEQPNQQPEQVVLANLIPGNQD